MPCAAADRHACYGLSLIHVAANIPRHHATIVHHRRPFRYHATLRQELDASCAISGGARAMFRTLPVAAFCRVDTAARRYGVDMARLPLYDMLRYVKEGAISRAHKSGMFDAGFDAACRFADTMPRPYGDAFHTPRYADAAFAFSARWRCCT